MSLRTSKHRFRPATRGQNVKPLVGARRKAQMPSVDIRKQLIPHTKHLRASASPNKPSREVSTDDVIKQILNLFDLLGLNADQLAKRVKGLRGKARSSRQPFYHEAAIGEVLTNWHQDLRYLDDSGLPKPLKMSGKEPSFAGLAKRSVPNVDPKTLLRELKDVGAVSISSEQKVCVEMRFLLVYVNRKFAIHYTLASLNGFVKTLTHNLLSEPTNADQLFHRVARNARIDLRDLPTLKVRIKRQGQNFLESCDNWLTYKAKNRSKSKGRRAQVYVGVYLAVDEPAKSAGQGLRR